MYKCPLYIHPYPLHLTSMLSPHCAIMLGEYDVAWWCGHGKGGRWVNVPLDVSCPFIKYLSTELHRDSYAQPDAGVIIGIIDDRDGHLCGN